MGFFYLGGDIILSLLANLGILSSAYSKNLNVWELISLVLVTLGIYLLDRSYDSFKETTSTQTKRGLFYRTKIKIIIPVGLIFLIFSLTIAIWQFSLSFLLGGFWIGLGILIYFCFYYFLKPKLFPKEIFIAVFYCLGVAYPIYYNSFPSKLIELFPYILFFLSILAEVMALSLNDFEWDAKLQFHSLSQSLGKKKTKIIFLTLTFIGLGISIFLSIQYLTTIKLVAMGYIFYFIFLFLIEEEKIHFRFIEKKILLELSYCPFFLYYLL